MKGQYKELREDVLDEEKAVDEIIERLRGIRDSFDPQKQDNLTKPTMGTYLMNFYNGVENILRAKGSELVF